MWRAGTALIAIAALSLGVHNSASAEPEPMAMVRPSAADGVRVSIPAHIRSVARSLRKLEEDYGTIPKEVAKNEFEDWIRSEGTDCPFFLPGRYFCPRSKTVWSQWGVGYALSWRGESPGAWTTPYRNRRLGYALTPGKPFWLTCWTYGHRVTDGGRPTGLWYKLSNDYWVNDGWLDTGTDFRIPGVARC